MRTHELPEQGRMDQWLNEVWRGVLRNIWASSSFCVAMSVFRLVHALFVLPVILVLAQCGDDKLPSAGGSAPDPTSKPALQTAASPGKIKIFWTEELIHKEVKYYNPAYENSGQFRIENGEVLAAGLDGAKISNLQCLAGRPLVALYLSDTGVSDLSPLKGMPLAELYLERTKVMDLSPLRGTPLQKLYLTGTAVSDLSPLEGMPLVELNVKDAPITSVAPLARCPIGMLWLTGCPVEDIIPLRKLPLVSLTLHRTRVRDLSPLAGTALKRLHIGETPVEDLSPLKGMHLNRLVFTPARIKAGLDVARALPVTEIGTRFEEEGNDLAAPAVFWAGQPKS